MIIAACKRIVRTSNVVVGTAKGTLKLPLASFLSQQALTL
jgi:hypothetical protein